MKSKNKGKLLERMVFILERSTVNNPSTKILVNHKIADRDGILREVDIYVELEANGKTLRYAFECKNHKRGIELKDIDAFANKFDRRNIILFFVTTSHYQTNARTKAASLGITLYTLSKRTAETGNQLSLSYFQNHFVLTGYTPLCTGALPEESSKVLTNCKSCRAAMQEMVDKIVPALAPQLHKMLCKAIDEYKDPGMITRMFGISNVADFTFKGNYIEPHIITHNQTEIIWISGFQLHFKVWYDVFRDIPLNLEHFTYTEDGQPQQSRQLSYAEFLFENENMFIALTQIADKSIFTIGNIEKPEVAEQKATDPNNLFGMQVIQPVEFERVTPEYSHH